jgi:endonuclease/exonuclease/phosphatase family metal-dependent hydrolase
MVAIGLPVGIAAAAWGFVGRGPDRGTSTRASPAVAAVGPFAMLHLVFLQNPGFVASSIGLGMGTALAVILLADAAALVALGLSGRAAGRRTRIGAAVALVALAVPLARGGGWPMALVVIAAGPVAASLLAEALERAPAGSPGPWRTGVGMALGGALFVLLALVYYIQYDSPLPLPNSVVPPAAAALIGMMALGRADEAPPIGWQWSAVPAAFMAVPLAVALTAPVLPGGGGAGGTFRLVSYNIHSSVDTDGQVNPEAIARVIEAQRPDVVVLQEVNRGWAVAGAMDQAEWLSRRLRMPYAFGEAADGQFGNLLLSRFPMGSVDSVLLPKAGGPMFRNYVRAELDLGGESVTMIVTHLDHRDEGRDTRLAQLDLMLAATGGPRTVLAGDMNAEPGSEEIGAITGAGFISAQDQAGDPEMLTWPSEDTRVRIDWIFGTEDVAFRDFVIPATTASDHLPLAVTVSLE